MKHSGKTIDWGRTRYREALERQKVRVTQRKADMVPDTLIFTEHHPVYTVGVRPGAQSHLVWNPEQLNAAGIEVVETNRGGDITYHGPGQIVGYPILSWQEQRDLHLYLRKLEDVLIQSVAQFGLKADRREGKTGIWIENRKLAAIGVAVKSWITYHGFALNVCPDLSHFTGIVPCGITDGTVTSLKQELGEQCPELETVKSTLSLEFWKVFGEHAAYGNA
ncbi:MAG: lipoyl(octanoyl) transferase LipB [Opitutales bacterium]|nr:lipoyl(octanoyl) transferase LipB [Opitutales bacterium]